MVGRVRRRGVDAAARVRPPARADDYLLYPEGRNKHTVSWAKPKQRMNGQTAHRWWYHLLRDAGLVEKDVMPPVL